MISELLFHPSISTISRKDPPSKKRSSSTSNNSKKRKQKQIYNNKNNKDTTLSITPSYNYNYNYGNNNNHNNNNNKVHQELHQTETRKYIKDAIYGGLDGIITTFGCVSGVAGARLSFGIILCIGLANLFADGLSMAAGNYLGTKSEMDFIAKERKREEYEVDNFPDVEMEEIREIYAKKGFSGNLLEEVVQTICSDKKIWVDTMMVEELFIFEEEHEPWKSALVTFLSFFTIGFIPLIIYVIALFFPGVLDIAFQVTITLTLLTIFGLGCVKGVVTQTWWLRSGIEMLGLGGLAALVAYQIGYWLKDLI